MISFTVQILLFTIKIQPNKSVQDKESLICLTPKPSQTFSGMIKVSLWPPPSPPLTTLITSYWAFLESLMPLKNWCWIIAKWSKNNLNHSIRFYGIFSNIVHLKCPHFQIAFLKFTSCDNQAFSRVYSNDYCNCSFEREIIKIGQSSHKMYSNNVVNYQESMTMLNACTQKVWKFIECTLSLVVFKHWTNQTKKTF